MSNKKIEQIAASNTVKIVAKTVDSKTVTKFSELENLTNMNTNNASKEVVSNIYRTLPFLYTKSTDSTEYVSPDLMKNYRNNMRKKGNVAVFDYLINKVQTQELIALILRTIYVKCDKFDKFLTIQMFSEHLTNLDTIHKYQDLLSVLCKKWNKGILFEVYSKISETEISENEYIVLNKTNIQRYCTKS